MPRSRTEDTLWARDAYLKLDYFIQRMSGTALRTLAALYPMATSNSMEVQPSTVPPLATPAQGA